MENNCTSHQNGEFLLEMSSSNKNSEIRLIVCDCESDCIHNAAKVGDKEKIKYLLQNGADANSVDKSQRTAMHWISSNECGCETCLNNSVECMELLVNSSYYLANKNAQDANGETPLYLSVFSQNMKCTKLLLEAGANPSIPNNRGVNALSIMAMKMPELMVSLMDKGITVDKMNPYNERCVLKLDFSTVAGCHGMNHKSREQKTTKEMTLLASLLGANETSQQIILAHPLAEIFLNEKWKRVRKYLILFFMCYMLWLISFSSYIIKVFFVSCPYDHLFNNTGKVIDSGKLSNMTPRSITSHYRYCETEDIGINLNLGFIIFMTAVMVINEVIKIFISPKLYFKTKVNAASWILIGMVIITTGPVVLEPNSKPDPWQYQAAAMAVFFAWAFLLTQLGTFPCLGRYLEILGYVLKNFAVSMLTFSSLIVAFSLSFTVLFPGEDGAFSNFTYAILKVLVMMTGEVDYQDTFYDKEKHSSHGPIIGHILYAGFVIIMAIVLMNLLIGLTVSDIQTLESKAELAQVSRQIVNNFRLESSFFSKKLNFKAFDVFRENISVLRPNTNKDGATDSFFRFYPNDPNDRSVPQVLKSQALKIAMQNYQQGLGPRCEGEGTNSNPTRSLCPRATHVFS